MNFDFDSQPPQNYVFVVELKLVYLVTPKNIGVKSIFERLSSNGTLNITWFIDPFTHLMSDVPDSFQQEVLVLPVDMVS